jgi:hypothetical protein
MRLSRSYQLHFQDHSAPDQKVSGIDLLSHGVAAELSWPLSSELIFFDEVN